MLPKREFVILLLNWWCLVNDQWWGVLNICNNLQVHFFMASSLQLNLSSAFLVYFPYQYTAHTYSTCCFPYFCLFNRAFKILLTKHGYIHRKSHTGFLQGRRWNWLLWTRCGMNCGEVLVAVLLLIARPSTMVGQGERICYVAPREQNLNTTKVTYLVKSVPPLLTCTCEILTHPPENFCSFLSFFCFYVLSVLLWPTFPPRLTVLL